MSLALQRDRVSDRPLPPWLLTPDGFPLSAEPVGGAEPASIYLHARYYDPQLGSFLSPDPIGPRGGLNSFAYGAGNPANLTDRNGLDPYDRDRPWWAPWAIRFLGWLLGGGDSNNGGQRPCPFINCNTPELRHPNPNGGPSQGPAHPRGQPSTDPNAGPTTDPTDGPSPVNPEIVEPVEPQSGNQPPTILQLGQRIRRGFGHLRNTVGVSGVTGQITMADGLGFRTLLSLGEEGIGVCGAPAGGFGFDGELTLANKLPRSGFFLFAQAEADLNIVGAVKGGGGYEWSDDFSGPSGQHSYQAGLGLGPFGGQLAGPPLRLEGTFSDGKDTFAYGDTFKAGGILAVGGGVCISTSW